MTKLKQTARLGLSVAVLLAAGAAHATQYAKVAIVAQAGGDYTDPGTAMTELGLWCGSPTAASPCLLKIMPGTYDLGASFLAVPPFVDVEGSGRGATRLVGTGSTSFGVLKLDAQAEVRGLTVERTFGSGVRAYGPGAVYIGRSGTLRDVTVNATGFYALGVLTVTGSATLDRVTVNANANGTGTGAWGVHVDPSATAATIVDSTISAVSDATFGTIQNRGVLAGGGVTQILNSRVTVSGLGEAGTVGVDDAMATVVIAGTQIAAYGSGWGLVNEWDGYRAGTVVVDASQIYGQAYSVQFQKNTSTSIGATKLGGGPTSTWGVPAVVRCAGVYTDAYLPMGPGCTLP